MSGNVWEWTCSLYDKDYGVAEGKCANVAIVIIALENWMLDSFLLLEGMSSGRMNWEQGIKDLTRLKANHDRAWRYILSTGTDDRKGELQKNKEAMDSLLHEMEGLFATHDRTKLNLFVANDFYGMVEQFRGEEISAPLAVRGGGWDDDPARVRSANRGRGDPLARLVKRGFRLARSL